MCPRRPMPIEIEDATPARRGPEKLATFNKLGAVHKVAVQLDPRRAGVLVPPHYREIPNLILNFSYRFDSRLDISDTGLSQTLSFKGYDFNVIVPWSAVYAMWDPEIRDSVIYWSADLPVEMFKAFGITQMRAN